MGWGGALIEHIPSALQIPYLIERGVARRGPEHSILKHWELWQGSRLPEFKGSTDGSGLPPPCWHSIHVSSLPRVIHLKHEHDLSFLSVSSSLTKPKLHHMMSWLLVSGVLTLCCPHANCCRFPRSPCCLCFLVPPYHSLYGCLCLKCPSVPF